MGLESCLGNPERLIGFIMKHNIDIQQGFIIDYPIDSDETLLREFIENSNDIVELKYRDNQKTMKQITKQIWHKN